MSFILSNYVDPILVKTNNNICNASIICRGNTYKLIGRQINYAFIEINGNTYGWPFTPKYYTNNLLYDIDINTGETIYNKSITRVTDTDKQQFDIFGDEDIRAINWMNKTYISYTKIHANAAEFANNKHEATIHFAELDDDYNIVNENAIKTDRNIEKNWAPIECMPFTYMYDFNTLTTIDSSGNKMTRSNYDLKMQLRGSTPIIKIGQNYICIVHERYNNDFYHRFIILNEHLQIMRNF